MGEAAQERPTDFMRHVPDFQGDGYDFETGRTFNTRLALEFGIWEEDAGEDSDLAALKAVHERAVGTFGEVLDTLHQVAKDDDPSLNASGRLKLAARVIEPKLEELATMAAREVARVTAEIEREQAEVARAMRVKDAAAAVLHDGIRRHWQGLDAAARATQSRMADRLDTETLEALATGPAYLSGLTDEQQARIRTELARRIAPERVERVARLRTGLECTAQALAALDRKANRFIDFDKARALIAREASRNA